MKCPDAISAMLECELGELSPRGTSALSNHIANCLDCRARAETITSRTDALRVAVASVRAGEPLTRTRRARRAPRRARMIGALVVAASLFAFVVLREQSPAGEVPAGPPNHAPEQGIITIEAAQGRAVSIRRMQDTVDVVFHQPMTNE